MITFSLLAGQTSNLVSFQLGNANDNYRATVVLRIVDVLGDYTDVMYSVRVGDILLPKETVR